MRPADGFTAWLHTWINEPTVFGHLARLVDADPGWPGDVGEDAQAAHLRATATDQEAVILGCAYAVRGRSA